LVVLTLVIFFASLPVYLALLQTLCPGPACANEALLMPSQAGVLTGIGLYLGTYAALTVALSLALVVVCVVVSTLIAWRRSDDRMAMLVALMLVTFGPIGATSTVRVIPFPWQVPNACLFFLALALLVLVFLLFPIRDHRSRPTVPLSARIELSRASADQVGGLRPRCALYSRRCRGCAVDRSSSLFAQFPLPIVGSRCGR
jgi:hypothetical protein